jgi:tetratricopeptide (TPR) repeat protein
MPAVNRKFWLIATIIFAGCVTCAGGQDLGTFNKLFKGSSAAASPKTTSERKTRPVPKAKRHSVSTASRSVKKSSEAASETVVATKRSGSSNILSGSMDSLSNDVRFKNFAANIKRPRALTPQDLKLVEKLLGEAAAARYNRIYPSAEASYRHAFEINPWDPRTSAGLGSVYSDEQRWQKAAEAYLVAVETDPKNPLLQIALSYVLCQPVMTDDVAERYALAEKAARAAVQLAPGNALAHDQLGSALEARGLVGVETESEYRRAISIEISFAPAYAHLGRLLRRKGRTAESEAEYQKAIQLANDAPNKVLVADILQSEQRFADSEGLLRKVLIDDARNLRALMLYGNALIVKGSMAEAESTIRFAVAVSGNAYRPAVLLSSLFVRQGKLEQAESKLFEAQRMASTGEKRELAGQFEQLGDAYIKAGKKLNAARVYRIASNLDSGREALASKLAQAGGN